ncbi:MAG TPA: hypothetical protein VL986_00935 [Terracidiphilus sp.]|nr:hypothetical protein [Terracidiphilus sp.]
MRAFKSSAAPYLGATLLAFTASLSALAQTTLPNHPRTEVKGHSEIKERLIPSRFPAEPSIAPSFSVPIEPLGFTAPGPIYLGARNTMASLDFIGENKLLFTFRVPGLLHRDTKSNDEDERQIRAVVLNLPQGTVEAENVFTVHDRARYLWMLKDGHFLLRDRNTLMEGDPSLNLKPFLNFPGPLEWIEVDPTQQYIVANSREPAPAKAANGDQRSAPALTPGAASGAAPGGASSMDLESRDDERIPEIVVRILRRDSGKVVLVSRVKSAVHLPINDQGYLDDLEGKGWERILNLSYFDGGSRVLGSVESSCELRDDFVSAREILITGCSANGGDKLVAMNTDGKILWVDVTPPVAVWPELAMAPNGRRIARETLGVTRAITAYSALDSDDIKGQWVTVYDAATGDMALETQASPVLDAGGNVAISPSGRRVAVVNAGAIQVFELPDPPPLPATMEDK